MANIIRGLTRLPIVSRGIVCSINIVSEKVAQVVRTILEATLIKLSSVDSSYYKLSKPWVATGDFSLPVYFVTSRSSTQLIYGDSLSTDSFVTILTSGVIRAKIDGVSIDSTATFNDGEEHFAVVSREGSTVFVYVDGVLVASGTASGTITLDSIGTYIHGSNFNGIISRPKLIDLTTPANSLHFTLGELTKDYELPVNNVFGSELIDGSWGTVTANVTALNQNVSFDAVDDSFIYAQHSVVFTAGVSYLVEVVVNNYVSGEISLAARFSNDTIVANVTGSITVAFTASQDNTTLEIKRERDTVAVMDVNISIREVTNVLEYINIDTLPDVRIPVTKVGGAWLGNERWDNAVIENDWVDEGGGVHTVSTTIQLNNSANMFASSGMIIGDDYLCKFVESGFTGNGKVGFRTSAFTGALSGRSLSVNGLYSGILTAASTTPEIFRYVDSGTGTSRLSQISIREYIGIAPQITPVTQGMTLTAAWVTVGIAYGTLSDKPVASARVDATISNTDTGILMEAGGSTIGLMLYVHAGVIYFQCGNGSGYGTASNRAEIAYTLPVGEFKYIVEWSASTILDNAVLYINGTPVGSQTFDSTSLAGSDDGTIGQVKTDCARNRGGWTANASGGYTNTITKCDVFINQVPPNV